MNMLVLVWVLAIVVAVLVGKEVGKLLFGKNEKLAAKKRGAQVLATKLRDAGMKRLPKMLDDFVVGDVNDLIAQINDLAKLVEQGDEAIVKELEATFDSVLAKKLATPEGLAYVKAKMAEAAPAPAPAPAPAEAPKAPALA